MLITSLDDLIKQWTADSVLDESEIARETARIPQLHAKYAGIRSRFRLKYSRIKGEYNKILGLKRAYYRGELDQSVLDEYGWDQWVKNKVLNTAMSETLASDPDLIEIVQKMELYQEIVDYCEYVLKEINQRTWQMRVILDSERYFGGNEWQTK